MNGELAYVPQQAWIFSGTVKENVVFGETFDADRFGRVVEACALTDDLEGFELGADAVIGEHGSNLSGGQKQVGCIKDELEDIL